MIECPHCKKLELVGAIFCRECGTQLLPTEAGAYPSPGAVKKPGNDQPFTHNSKNVPQSPAPTKEPGRPNSSTPIRSQAASEVQPKSTITNSEQTNRITLQVLQTGELISVAEEDEVTLGRAGTGQPIVPDIDLTPYKGLEAGVSRLHASIRIKGEEIYIMDLGSANGTRLNGDKLPPSTPHRLEDESVITLGKLKLKVLIKS
jgi:pSer/pThr/pTyr-binding forkhead associated (FHA) protein